MGEERIRILNMVKEGKISPEEGAKLLSLLEGEERRPSGRWLRVRVRGEDGEEVKINLPLSLARVLLKWSGALPERVREQLEDKGIDLGAFSFEALEEETSKMEGRVDLVKVEDGAERVEIYIE